MWCFQKQVSSLNNNTNTVLLSQKHINYTDQKSNKSINHKKKVPCNVLRSKIVLRIQIRTHICIQIGIFSEKLRKPTINDPGPYICTCVCIYHQTSVAQGLLSALVRRQGGPCQHHRKSDASKLRARCMMCQALDPKNTITNICNYNLWAPPLPPTSFFAYSFVSNVGFGLIWYAALDSRRNLAADCISQK